MNSENKHNVEIFAWHIKLISNQGNYTGKFKIKILSFVKQNYSNHFIDSV